MGVVYHSMQPVAKWDIASLLLKTLLFTAQTQHITMLNGLQNTNHSLPPRLFKTAFSED